MAKSEHKLIELLTALRDAYSSAVEVINSYLAVVASMELDQSATASLFLKESRNMLDISLKDDKWVIMPHDYLGSEVSSV